MKHEIKYVNFKDGRHGKRFYYYRRKGWLRTIRDTHGRPLAPGEPGFDAAWHLLHAEYERRTDAVPRRADTPEPKQKIEHTFSHLIAMYKQSPGFKNKAARTQSEYERVLSQLEEICGDTAVRDMTRERVMTIRDAKADTPRQADNFVQLISILCSYAEDYPRRFGLPNYWSHPARKITKLKNKQNTNSHKPWPDEIWELVIEHGRNELVRFIKAARYTGQRGGDVAKMKLSDFKDGMMHVVQEKTGEKAWIPMVPELQTLIEEAPKTNILLFPNSAGNAWEATAWGNAIRKLMTKIGYPGYSLHGLRKNATIELLEAGCTPDEVKAITGHETTAMIELYGKDVEKKRQATAAIAKLNVAKKNKR